MSSKGAAPSITLLLLPLFLSFGRAYSCLEDPAEAYRLSGAVCRLTYPAAAVLNEKTTKVIEAAFQHARYPSMQGEKSLPFIGKVSYGLENLEIHNLSIGRSEFELVPGKGIALKISNVSAVFKGTIQYGYGSWLVNLAQSLDLEIESQIDLGINPRLYCGKGKVAADTSDCYLRFHKLRLHLQGDKEPNWLKKLFTDFITFTVKLVVKGQICKEINKLADILSDFIQDTAAHFLSDGDISVDISVTTAPAITASYIESYHKGVTNYNNTTSALNESAFHPSQLTEDRMLFFWFSDELFNPLIAAAHHDGRFRLNVSAEELSELLKTSLSSVTVDSIQTCLAAASAELRVWSSSVPHLRTFNTGSRVTAQACGELHCGGQGPPALFFETSVLVDVTASYADKKLFLHGSPKKFNKVQQMEGGLAPDTEVPKEKDAGWSVVKVSSLGLSHKHRRRWRKSDMISVLQAEIPSQNKVLQDEAQVSFIKEAVEKVGIPKVLSVLQVEITRLLDKQGANLFDIIDPEVLPRDGFTVTKMDFGFPHHLLVDFLQKTLQ